MKPRARLLNMISGRSDWNNLGKFSGFLMTIIPMILSFANLRKWFCVNYLKDKQGLFFGVMFILKANFNLPLVSVSSDNDRHVACCHVFCVKI